MTSGTQGAAPAITTAPTSGKSSRFFRRNKNYSQNIISGFHRRNKKTPPRLFYFPALFHIIEARGSLFQIDHDIFRLAVMFQHDLVSFAADAGLLVSAEGSACGNRVVRINPDTTRLYTAADFHGRIQAACKTPPPRP